MRRLLSEDEVLRAVAPSQAAIHACMARPTTIESVAKAFELYADRPCMGERPIGPAGQPEQRFRTVRYADVWARTKAFASGLKAEGIAGTGSFVGICGFGSSDWVVADLACLYLAAVSAPLQTGMSPVDLRQVIQDTDLSCIVCSAEQLESIEAVLPECPKVKSLVVMDVHDVRMAQRLGAAAVRGVRVRTMRSVEERGRERGVVPLVLPRERGQDDPLMTFYVTSGSTGTPKAAIMTETRLRALWHIGYFGRMMNMAPDFPLVALNYMPLNHAVGRLTVAQAIVRGGLTYFVAKSDMSTLFEDIRLARPTHLSLVPRVSEMIYRHYRSELARRSEGAPEGPESARISRAIMGEMRESFLGDRLLLAMTSTAPTPPEVVSFLKQCFQVPIIDGYGTSEAGPLTSDDHMLEDLGITWTLVDVPELGYRTTDKPYPRGELHVKSPFMTAGYYSNPEATRELFDEAGYLNTGDIMEQRGPSRLVWIDRAKNVLKLAQGEFVATSRLEGLYAANSPYIRQIYIHGSSLRSYLLAVVVPDMKVVSSYLSDRGDTSDAAIKTLIRGELDRIAREQQLRSHEVPRDFIIDREPFTVENNLLTASNKQSRPRLRAHYAQELEALTRAIERTRIEELYTLQRAPGDMSIPARVSKAIGVSLGLRDLDVSQMDQSFIQLGGDSLNAVDLETLLRRITGVSVPVGFLLDRTSSVRAIAQYIEQAVSPGAPRSVTFADVHTPRVNSAGVETIRADDVKLEKFLGPAELEAAQHVSATRPAGGLPRTAEVALLTGANGFLGRFLSLELLERLSGERKLYALVRGRSDAEARQRLASSYRSDRALSSRFEELASGGRLQVLAGDMMQPRFGLSTDVYARLAEEVDLIVHNGALVNHALSYQQLFEPNVLGTLRVIRLALTARIKSISHVSTIAVVGNVRRSAPILETDALRELVPEQPTQAGYAAGYAASKWVSELLLRAVHDELAVPIAIFRPSEIMAHSRFRGQVNTPDFFTRLIAGLVYTSLAPKSFYSPDAPAYVKHYDGLPVDSVARSIAAPSVQRVPRATEQPTAGFATYHVVNPHHADGVSLDDVVTWVRAAGYPIERVADYAQWYRSFHDRLNALPEAQRQHSPLAILEAWSMPQGVHMAPEIMNTELLARLRAIDPKLADLPHVDQALIQRMLDDMAVLGVIDRPMRAAG